MGFFLSPGRLLTGITHCIASKAEQKAGNWCFKWNSWSWARNVRALPSRGEGGKYRLLNLVNGRATPYLNLRQNTFQKWFLWEKGTQSLEMFSESNGFTPSAVEIPLSQGLSLSWQVLQVLSYCLALPWFLSTEPKAIQAIIWAQLGKQAQMAQI